MPRRMTPKKLEAYAAQSLSYETSPPGRLHIVCPQCRALVMLFDDLDPKVRAEIGRVGRSSSRAYAAKMLGHITGCDLRQAKATGLHLRLAESHCHKCGHFVPRGALLCSQCMSVNLDW
jgi:hypothetical protein